MITLAKRTALNFLRRYKRGALRSVRTTLFTEDGPAPRTLWLDVRNPHTVMEVSHIGGSGLRSYVELTNRKRILVRRFFTCVHDGSFVLVGASADYIPNALYLT